MNRLFLYQTYIKDASNNLRAVFFTSCCVATCERCKKKTIVIQNPINSGRSSQWQPLTACCRSEEYLVIEQITPLQDIEIIGVNSYTLEEAQLNHDPEKFVDSIKGITEATKITFDKIDELKNDNADE